jgi:hypothetical protein
MREGRDGKRDEARPPPPRSLSLYLCLPSHISHGQQALVKEEHDAQDGEEDAKAGEADPDFCC